MLDDFQDDEPVKNSDFLDEFRQRLNSQPLENIEERKKEISKSQHIFLGTILGVGLAGIASWVILSPDYKKTENIDIPVVRRANTAIKVQPANPGGMEILNQDKSVYDIVEKCNSMRKTGFEIPKIAFMPKQLSDVTRLFQEGKKVQGDHILCAMGPEGMPSRILSTFSNSYLTYISPKETMQNVKEVRQLTPYEVNELYRFKSISENTPLTKDFFSTINKRNNINPIKHIAFIKIETAFSVDSSEISRWKTDGKFLSLAFL